MRRKRIIKNIGIALLFVVGFGVFAYPKVSDQWNTYRQSLLISKYDQRVMDLTDEEYEQYFEAAKDYNSEIRVNSFSGDAVSKTLDELMNKTYWHVLNINQDGIMGYVSIPKIDQKLPIYHGTLEDVLQKGVGHLEGTSLPVGGASSHTVLSAHRGLPSARLFTDLDQMEIGDIVYLYILGKKMTYKVDQILPMVDKYDLETLSSAMQIEPAKDYVTMLTCTPYGVNSHRLLVRSSRVKDVNLEKIDNEFMDHKNTFQKYYMLYVILAVPIGLGIFGIVKLVLYRKKLAWKGI